jgi:hypothetical protein
MLRRINAEQSQLSMTDVLCLIGMAVQPSDMFDRVIGIETEGGLRAVQPG